MMKYQHSKLVMEKFLRRSFYDAVLELYEGAQGYRIISISLEGSLSLMVNKDEQYFIKLNEVAQRADDRDENGESYKTDMELASGVGIEEGMVYGSDTCIVKKEEDDQTCEQTDDRQHSAYESTGEYDHSGDRKDAQEMKYMPVIRIEEDLETKTNVYHVEHKIAVSDMPVPVAMFKTENAVSTVDLENGTKAESTPGISSYQPQTVTVQMETQEVGYHQGSGGDDSKEEIRFVPVGHVESYKRKIDHEKLNESVAGTPKEKRSRNRKKRKASAPANEEPPKSETKEKEAETTAVREEGNNSGDLLMLPHTATGPIVIEDDDSREGGGTELTTMTPVQMRPVEPAGLRINDIEELARHQQQWQIVAYQRSIMEKSYLEKLQQYQRDAERMRWELSAQQPQEISQSSGEYQLSVDPSDKSYNQVETQTVSEGAISAAAAVLEHAKKQARVGKEGTESPSSHYSKETGQGGDDSGEIEEGELSKSCGLCGAKFTSDDQLIQHMEKHRATFERSCSVCQSGTLTGNMLLLHMVASHGPETSFASSIAATATVVPSLPAVSAAIASTGLTQVFPGSVLTAYSVMPDQAENLKILKTEKTDADTADPEEGQKAGDAKSESGETVEYTITASSSSKVDEQSDDLAQESFLGFSSQFYPLVGCPVCKEKFALSEALDQHIETHHKDAQVTFTCKPCYLEFPTHQEYSQHMMRHESSSTNMKCSHCLKSFKSIKQLRLHYVAAHGCCHFCEYCRAGFPDSMSLQLHEQIHTLDPEKLTFRCDICSKAFFTQSQCSAHKRTHKDEKAHACDVCGSTFFKRGDLTKHVRTVHSPSRLFACKFCGKKGTRMDNMRSHVRSHHKNMTRDQIVDMIEVIE